MKGWDSGKLQEAGDNLFLAFFKAHPEEQAHFSKFANVKSLAGNAAFQAQTLAVASYLDQMIKGDAVNLFRAKVNDHVAKRVGADSFNKILDFMPDYFGNRGGDAQEWLNLCHKLKGCL